MRSINFADILCLVPFALLFFAFLYNLYRRWEEFRLTGANERPRNLEENTPLDYGTFPAMWIYEHVSNLVERVAPGRKRRRSTRAGDIPSSPLLDALIEALHLLVIGPSRSGKTSLVHALAMRWRQTSRVVVCDPDAAPGLWDGCEVYGAGDTFDAIDEALILLSREIGIRRQQRATGIRQFSALRVILCEYADITRYCEQARGTIEDCLRRGGKLGISLVLDVQDKQRKTLDLDGATHLLQNFSHICEVRKALDGHRTATVTVNDGDQSETTYDIPLLPNLDTLIRQPARAEQLADPGTVQTLKNLLNSQLYTIPVQDGTSGTDGAPMPGTASTLLPMDDEATAIRILLEQMGSKNKVADFLGGSKTTAYKRINRALGLKED
jgi:GTPase SAR1 family protein